MGTSLHCDVLDSLRNEIHHVCCLLISRRLGSMAVALARHPQKLNRKAGSPDGYATAVQRACSKGRVQRAGTAQ